MKRLKNILMSVTLSVCIVASSMPIEVLAKEAVPGQEESAAREHGLYEIVSFEELNEEVRNRSVPVGTALEDLSLPETLTVSCRPYTEKKDGEEETDRNPDDDSEDEENESGSGDESGEEGIESNPGDESEGEGSEGNPGDDAGNEGDAGIPDDDTGEEGSEENPGGDTEDEGNEGTPGDDGGEGGSEGNPGGDTEDEGNEGESGGDNAGEEGSEGTNPAGTPMTEEMRIIPMTLLRTKRKWSRRPLKYICGSINPGRKLRRNLRYWSRTGRKRTSIRKQT